MGTNEGAHACFGGEELRVFAREVRDRSRLGVASLVAPYTLSARSRSTTHSDRTAYCRSTIPCQYREPYSASVPGIP
eukprot:3904019-Rhodomonas_salina.5